MKKLIIATLLCCTLSASAQTYIKTNALYWIGLLPNVQVETNLGAGFTFQGEVNASAWADIGGRPYLGAQFIAGARWYPKAAFKGFYVGGDFAMDIYKVSKWDHPSYEVQHGFGYYLGLTLGYQLPITKRWNMDFFVGGGWHLGKYWGENTRDGSMYAPFNSSGEWLPYKIGVTFAYRLSKK